MARKAPVYSSHSSGQARVRISGKIIYLGPYNSAESREKYDRIVSAWLRRQNTSHLTLSVAELALLYLEHAQSYYVKEGKETTEVGTIRSALRLLIVKFGRCRIRDFGPLRLKEVRNQMVAVGWARSNINAQVNRICRMFRWGVENEYVPSELLASLESVAGLRKGKTTATERPKVLPISDKTVDLTLPHMPPIVADMVKLQRVTGMRPEEVCSIRPGDVDRSDVISSIWVYRPQSHKTEHHGLDRTIFIGPQGQKILAPYLLRAAESFCFSPKESDKLRRENLAANRKTPMKYGNRAGTNRRSSPRKTPGDCYETTSYRRAIERACDLAFKPEDETELEGDELKEWLKAWKKAHRWTPNRLRHSFATLVRKKFGLEAAQVLLGHAGADVTQIYAERDAEKGKEVAAAVG